MAQSFDSFDAVQDERDNLQGQLEAMADKNSSAANDLLARIDDLETFLANETEHDIEIIDAALEAYHGDLDNAQALLSGGYMTFASAAEYAEEYVDSAATDIPESIRNYIDFDAMGSDMLSDASHAEIVNGIVIWNN